MRKNQRGLLIIISVLTIVSFVWLYNRTDLQKVEQTTVATIYGKPVSGTDFARLSLQLQVAYSMGLSDLVQTLAGRSQSKADEEYVWNTLVLRHMAAKLNIEPSNESVGKRIETLPAFETGGKFDLSKYNGFLTEVLTPRGYTTKQMEEIVRDDLRLGRIQELVGATVAVGTDEIHTAFAEAYQKRHLSFVRLSRADFTAAATISPEEIKADYEKNKATLKTEGKRVVQYAILQLPDKDKTLQGKDLVAALQPLSTKAEEFSQKMTEQGANFQAVAASLGIEVKTTSAFTESEPPSDVSAVPTFAPTAFSLTAETPDSDVLQTDTAFYVLHLDKIEASQPKTLEQATAEITARLQSEKVQKLMAARATELKKQFSEALKSGKTFAQAAESAGLKAETLPAFSPAEPGEQSATDATGQFIMMRATQLKAGDISDLIETQDGGAVAFLEKIDPLDETKWNAEKDSVTARYINGKRDFNFAEWFRARRQGANVQIASRG